jgi:hypothetical protein
MEHCVFVFIFYGAVYLFLYFMGQRIFVLYFMEQCLFSFIFYSAVVIYFHILWDRVYLFLYFIKHAEICSYQTIAPKRLKR